MAVTKKGKPKSAEASSLEGARPASRRGGKRAGSGRKKSPIKAMRADYNEATQNLLIGMLPQLLGNLKKLADGGYERVEETFEESAIPTSPGLPGEIKLVCTKRVVSVAEPDRGANIYLVDRLLGRPTERKELSGPEGGAISLEQKNALDKVYGDKEET